MKKKPLKLLLKPRLIIYSLADLIKELQKLPSNATVHILGNLEDRPVEIGNNVDYDKDKNAVSFSGDIALID